MFFGLEFEDLAAVLAVACAVLVLVSPLLSVPVGFVLFFGLRKVKEGKPSGYLYYLLFRIGLVRWFPASLRGPHLLPPARTPFQKPNPLRLSPVRGDSDPASRSLAAVYFGTCRRKEDADVE